MPDSDPTKPSPRPPKATYEIATGLFLRALGLVYLLAIASLWRQIHGLIGSRGILPLSPYLEAAGAQLGAERFRLLPTLSWLSASDFALHLLCALGVGLALLVMLGRLQAPALAGLWLIYLSLVTDGRTFLAFQWDNLLLETGLLALFLGVPRWRTPLALPQPVPLARFLLYWLLFRLMLGSGLVKLSSGDATWRDLTALHFHYETQPLPTWLGWYAHQLQDWFHIASCLAMFAVELLVPFLIWGPRRWRRYAAGAFIALQLLIALTGNYGFFNLLTLVLCLLLFDDAAWPGGRNRARVAAALLPARGWHRPWRWASLPLAVVIALVSVPQLARAAGLQVAWPQMVQTVHRAVAPYRSINSYGLFAVMTTERPEIIVEGSLDGDEWRTYRFKWKPGDLTRRPLFMAPHMPRLDWQMWFAALGTYQQNPWFLAFLTRLAEGSPPVLALLATDPFPAGPPRYLRARREDYRFQTPAGRATDGQWWQREPAGMYLPPVTAAQLEASFGLRRD